MSEQPALPEEQVNTKVRSTHSAGLLQKLFLTPYSISHGDIRRSKKALRREQILTRTQFQAGSVPHNFLSLLSQAHNLATNFYCSLQRGS